MNGDDAFGDGVDDDVAVRLTCDVSAFYLSTLVAVMYSLYYSLIFQCVDSCEAACVVEVRIFLSHTLRSVYMLSSHFAVLYILW